jgi:UDPglucose 6-dehydrogenase
MEKKRKKQYKICIVGAGHVGLVAAACFAELGHQVICTDSNKKKVDLLKNGKMPFYEPDLGPLVAKNYQKKQLSFTHNLNLAVKNSEIIFIAVSTPPRDDGSLDLTNIENVTRTIAENLNSYKLIVSKSTVPVQTGKKIKDTILRYGKGKADFEIASNPEFLREGQAVRDFFYPDRIVFGIESKRGEKILREIHYSVKAPIIVTDVGAAEIIKHASNSFLATKISFINAVSRVCDLAKVDVTQVAKAMGMDERIGKHFLNAGIGYGGSCFPKDLNGFEYIAKELGYNFNLLTEVKKINDSQPDYIVKRIKEHLWILKDKKIAILGLSFKPDTDDLRFAPSVSVINKLVEAGAKLSLYDPQGMAEAKRVLKKSSQIKFAKGPYQAVKNCDCLFVLTEWDQFKNLDLKRIKKQMHHPLIADGRNIFNKDKVLKLGFAYIGIGR